MKLTESQGVVCWLAEQNSSSPPGLLCCMQGKNGLCLQPNEDISWVEIVISSQISPISSKKPCFSAGRSSCPPAAVQPLLQSPAPSLTPPRGQVLCRLSRSTRHSSSVTSMPSGKATLLWFGGSSSTCALLKNTTQPARKGSSTCKFS